MDYEKIGSLICKLRKEKGLTQKQLGDKLHLSDKTISKWERGLGCPDISSLHSLADILGVNTEKILLGEFNQKELDGGNMKKLKFYMCPDCGNIIISTSNAEVSCCGRKLSALIPQKCDEAHSAVSELIDDEVYITVNHEMTKKHYISFAVYVSWDRYYLAKLYPEQDCSVRFPKLPEGKLYICCSNHGLFTY